MHPTSRKNLTTNTGSAFPCSATRTTPIAESYGVWGAKKMYGKTFMGIIRSAFLIDEKGLIEAVFFKVSPKQTVPKLMDALGHT